MILLLYTFTRPSMKYVLPLLAIMTLIFTAGLAHANDADPIIKKAVFAFEHLTQNVTYQYTSNTYGDVEWGRRYSTIDARVLANSTVFTGSFREELSDGTSVEQSHIWTDPSRAIYLEKAKNDGYVIQRDVVVWANEGSSTYSSFYVTTGLSDMFIPVFTREYVKTRTQLSLPWEEPWKVVNIQTAQYQSTDCWKVVVDHGGPAIEKVTTDHYVSKEHGLVVAKRQKKMYSIPKGKTRPVRIDVDQLTEISYGPPTSNGLPFPKSVKGWYVWPDGKRQPMTDIVFTEFKRYTPTADELDFEKNFGLKLPELPPKPFEMNNRPSGYGRWLWSAFIVAAFATVVTVYLRRRKSK
jgi:hypothetical protein